jgi:hypothetical protein
MWILVTCGGTSLAFLVVAWIVATFNCEDGCRPGSRWAPGAWGTTVELWGLALPALLAAGALTVAVAMGWRRTAVMSWSAVTGLLIAWCVFTGVSSVSLDFGASNSHWMWFAGLLVASGGGLIGLVASRETDGTS